MDKIRESFEALKKDGKEFSVLGSLGQCRLLTQTPFFHELGISTPVTICQDFDNLILEETEQLLDTVCDFYIVINTFQAAEVAHTTSKYNPDMVLSCPFMGTFCNVLYLLINFKAKKEPRNCIDTVGAFLNLLVLLCKNLISLQSRHHPCNGITFSPHIFILHMY